MTIVLLQRRKLGTNINNLSKVMHLVDGCTGLEPEIWSQNKYMVSTATQHQQRDEQI